jgi:hypothetical protein
VPIPPLLPRSTELRLGGLGQLGKDSGVTPGELDRLAVHLRLLARKLADDVEHHPPWLGPASLVDRNQVVVYEYAHVRQELALAPVLSADRLGSRERPSPRKYR